MKCKFCGAELPAGAFMCDMCGHNVNEKKITQEGGIYGDAMMTAPTDYVSVPIKEPSKWPKIIGISAAALVVVIGIIIALVILLKPKKPVDQLINSVFKTGALDSAEATMTLSEAEQLTRTSLYYVFDSKEKEARLFTWNEDSKAGQLSIFTPSGYYAVRKVEPEEYEKKSIGKDYEGDEYTTFQGESTFYVLERDTESKKYLYDMIVAMRKDDRDDFYSALEKMINASNSDKVNNNMSADTIRKLVENIKTDLRDEDKQKDVFNFSSSKEKGFTVCKMSPSFMGIVNYGVTAVSDVISEEQKQGLLMIAALASLGNSTPKFELTTSLLNGRISSASFSMDTGDDVRVYSLTLQKQNKADIPALASEYYKAYTKNK